MVVWQNRFFKTADGQVPVREFIEKQDKFEKSRIWRALEKLERLDGRLDPPYNEKVTGSDVFWELKMYRNLETKEHMCRILYLRLVNAKKHLLFHAFRSSGPHMPNGELRSAELLINDYRARLG